MKEILISVIIPTYKRNEFVERAIDSVIISSDGLKDCEIIVIDDNGENTAIQKENEIRLKKYNKYLNFKYIKHKFNFNGAVARNTGIKNARGKYVTFLDDDDEFTEDRISEIMNIIKNEDYDFIFSNVILKKKSKKVSFFKPNIDINNKNDLIFKLLCQYSFIGTGSNLICKRKIVNEIGGFDESFVRNQDIEFLIRYLEKCNKVFWIDKYIVIKNTEDHMNLPNIEKLLLIKEKLFNKYNYIIKNYKKEMIDEMYKANYYSILKLAIINGDKKNEKKIITLLKKYKVHNMIKTLQYLIKYNLIRYRNRLLETKCKDRKRGKDGTK